MALPDINLDDRSFEQLFTFMRKQIDTEAWVDHNASDPGIVLLELLCWIGEMLLYRANRVPDVHLAKFSNLIMEPPEPVTVPLTLTAVLAETRERDMLVEAGTRFATEFKPDQHEPDVSKRRPRRYVFETMSPMTFRGPNNPKYPTRPPTNQTASVAAREYLVIQDEVIGRSNGEPNQAFPLQPVLSTLGLPPDALAPVLLDFAHTSEIYNPNPRVWVGAEEWKLKEFLRTDESYVPSNHQDQAKHFMVDADERRIRFGDGIFGAKPARGQVIRCTYQILQGPDALVAEKELIHLLDPIDGLGSDEKIEVTNGDAEGGNFFFPPDVRRRESLKAFRRPRRLITAADFECVLLVDFNNQQKLAKRPGRVLHATALMNFKPQAPAQLSPGHVTVVVQITDSIEDELRAVVHSIERFLDRRRLIGTRTHVMSPTTAPLSVTAEVTFARDRNVAEMKRIIEDRIVAFLDGIVGGFDGKGWPLGGNVYRSKLFRLIEDVDGVDHVEKLTLSPADSHGDVVLGPLSLPTLASRPNIVPRT